MLSVSLFTEEVILAEDDNGPGDSMNVSVFVHAKEREIKQTIMAKMQ